MQRTRGFGLMKASILATLEGSAWFVALAGAAAVRMSLVERPVRWDDVVQLAAVAAAVQAVVGLAGWTLHRQATNRRNLATNDNRRADGVAHVVVAWLLASLTVAGAAQFLSPRPVPRFAVAAAVPAALLLMFGVRHLLHVANDARARRFSGSPVERVVVVGAGASGERLMRALGGVDTHVAVAVLDDDATKTNRDLRGVRVEGSTEELGRVASLTDATLVAIAVPTASSELIASVAAGAASAGIHVRVLAPETAGKPVLSVADLREVSDLDLLGRDETDAEVDPLSIRTYVSDKRVLITDASAAIGAELEQLLARLGCGRIETVRDGDGAEVRAAVERFGPDVIFHTAGPGRITELPAAGTDSEETSGKTTILLDDMEELLLAAVRCGTERFLNVSTRRDLDASSEDGRARSEAERLTTLMDEVADGTYASVRFASGSDRSSMSDLEAARLVLQAGAVAVPGEVMILDPSGTEQPARSPERERRSGKPGTGPGGIERRRLRHAADATATDSSTTGDEASGELETAPAS